MCARVLEELKGAVDSICVVFGYSSVGVGWAWVFRVVESPCLQSSILVQRRHSSGIDSFLGSVRRYPNSCRHADGICT